MTRLLLVVAFLFLTASATAQSVTQELDAYWAEVSRTVAEGDFEGYSALYHPDAVLVFAAQNASVSLDQALAGWKAGFDQTKAGELTASVEFRFERRLNSATTAHETGIFHYMAESDEGVSGAMVHFTALMVKKDGRWLMLMENQKELATMEEWETMGSGN